MECMTLTSGCFPFLHSQQTRLAEIYRRWEPIQHICKDLHFPAPTRLLENPFIVTMGPHAIEMKHRIYQGFSTNNKHILIDTIDSKCCEVRRLDSTEYDRKSLELPWKIPQVDTNVPRCQCICVGLHYSRESNLIAGLDNLRQIQHLTDSSEQVVVIVESESSIDSQSQSAIIQDINKEIPGFFTTFQLQTQIYMSSALTLKVVVENCFLASINRYVENFFKYVSQVFRCFDALVMEDDERVIKQRQIRKRNMDIYKQRLSAQSSEIENEIVKVFKESKEFLYDEATQSMLVEAKKKLSKKDYTLKLENQFITCITLLILNTIKSLLGRVRDEFSEMLGYKETISPSFIQDLPSLSIEKCETLSASLFHTLKNAISKILKNVLSYFKGDTQEFEIVNQFHSRLVAEASKNAKTIVQTCLEHHVKVLENMAERNMLDENTGFTCLRKRLKSDSYKLKLELKSVLRDVAEQCGKSNAIIAKETLKSRVHSDEVRHLMTRIRGVKAYCVDFDRMQIWVTSKGEDLKQINKYLKEELQKHGIYELDVIECGEEPLYKLVCVSAGDKVFMETNEKHPGSVGTLVKTNEGKFGLISAAHVISNNSSVWVKKRDSSEAVFVGKCIWSPQDTFSELFEISVIEFDEKYETESLKLGQHKHKDGRVFPCKLFTGDFEMLVGKTAFKNGATTEFTEGTFVRIQVLPDGQGRVLEAWMVESNDEFTEFINSGDSGATVYTFDSDKEPPINLISVAQGYGQSRIVGCFTSSLKQSIDKFESSTGKTLHVDQPL